MIYTGNMDLSVGDILDFGGVIVAIFIFLSYVKTRDQSMSTYIEGRDKALSEIHRRCEDKLEAIADKCLSSLNENTKAMLNLEKKIELMFKS